MEWMGMKASRSRPGLFVVLLLMRGVATSGLARHARLFQPTLHNSIYAHHVHDADFLVHHQTAWPKADWATAGGTGSREWWYGHWPPLLAVGCLVYFLVATLLTEKFRDVERERAIFEAVEAEEADPSADTGLRRSVDMRCGRDGFVELDDYISIDRDGGMDKIVDLMPGQSVSVGRFLRCLVLVIGVCFNIGGTIARDITAMEAVVDSHYVAVNELPGETENHREIKEYIAHAREQHASIVGEDLIFFVNLGEIAALAILFMTTMKSLITFLVFRKQPAKTFDAFSAVMDFADGFRWLGTFSALKLIGAIHPSLIARLFEEDMSRPFCGEGRLAKTSQALFFLVTRTCCALLGIFSFSVNLATASLYLYATEDNHWTATERFHWKLTQWSRIILLLIQCMSAVDLNYILKWRVFMVIAGGSDGKLDEDESVRFQVYLARIAQVAHDGFLESGRFVSFMVLMLTFDDLDAQRLLIQEDKAKKLKWKERVAIWMNKNNGRSTL